MVAQSGNKPTLSSSGKGGSTESQKNNTDETPEVEPNTLPDEPEVNEQELETAKKQDKSLADKLTSGEFDETDADDDPDQRGWIVHRTNKDGDVKEHRVPVQYWERYSRIHNL